MKKDCKDCRKSIPGENPHEWECTAKEYDIENKTCFQPRNSEALDEVLLNQEEQPVVSYFVHEADMMHKDADNERLHDTIKQVTKDMHRAYIFIIVFLVLSFTLRMWIWNNTISSMNDSIIKIATLHHSEVIHAEETDTAEVH